MKNLQMIPRRINSRWKEIFDAVQSAWFRLTNMMIGHKVDQKGH